MKPEFWTRVFSSAPEDIDSLILPSDAAALSYLSNLNVERFGLDSNGQGEPRSIRFTFEFSDDNPFFDNQKLVKEFHWRKQSTRNSKGKRRTWEGFVSEPVRINWKKGMDLTKGMSNALCDLVEVEKKQPGTERSDLPEFMNFMEKLEALFNADLSDYSDHSGDEDENKTGPRTDEEKADNDRSEGLSFFDWFGYRGRDVSAEQSAQAQKEEDERFAKIANGEEVEDDLDYGDDEDIDMDSEEGADEVEDLEVFPEGENLAIAIAEDLWPGAMRYYGWFGPFFFIPFPDAY